MAFQKIENVSIKGISACVPHHVEENADMPFYKEGEAEEVIRAIGIERRHVVTDGIIGSDLCEKAFNSLIKELKWDADSIDALVYCTQTPDYLSPPTVFVMHDKLNLSENCMCYEINHGCPGWVVGLSSIATLVGSKNVKRAVLLVGDCCTMHTSAYDREARPLFGDCGTATALEYDEAAAPIYFEQGTKSKDGKALYREIGGYRNPYTLENLKKILDGRLGKGPVSTEDVKMDSMGVFSFGITTIPKSIKNLCEHFVVDLSGVDKVVLHQANLFMLKKIIKKLKVDPEKAPISLKDYGNTEAATIPLTIVSQCKKDYETKSIKTIACGFGTGLSWASVYFETNKIICPEVQIL